MSWGHSLLLKQRSLLFVQQNKHAAYKAHQTAAALIWSLISSSPQMICVGVKDMMKNHFCFAPDEIWQLTNSLGSLTISFWTETDLGKQRTDKRYGRDVAICNE